MNPERNIRSCRAEFGLGIVTLPNRSVRGDAIFADQCDDIAESPIRARFFDATDNIEWLGRDTIYTDKRREHGEVRAGRIYCQIDVW